MYKNKNNNSLHRVPLEQQLLLYFCVTDLVHIGSQYKLDL